MRLISSRRLRTLATALRWTAILLITALLLPACRSSNERFATETAQATNPARRTPTNTPSGDILMIDGDPVLHVYVSSVDGPALYALTDERLFRWDDDVWEPTETRADGRAILVDPVLPERLYRGNHPACSLETSDPFTFSKSEDGGNTWRAVPGADNIRPLVVDPTLGDVVYGSDCGLAISTDAGETWREYYRSRDYTVVDAAAVGEQLLVLEVSVSGRGRLREINVTVPEDPEMVSGLVETGRVFDLDAGRERIVIGGLLGVTVSTDGGENWTTSRNGLEEVTVASEDELPPIAATGRPTEFGVLVVRLDPLHPQRLFAGTVRGLFISQDAGLTWDAYSAVNLDARVLDIQFAGGGNDIYVTTPNGVLVVPNP